MCLLRGSVANLRQLSSVRSAFLVKVRKYHARRSFLPTHLQLCNDVQKETCEGTKEFVKTPKRISEIAHESKRETPRRGIEPRSPANRIP